MPILLDLYLSTSFLSAIVNGIKKKIKPIAYC